MYINKFWNGNHYNLLKLNEIENELVNYESNSKDIETKKFKINIDNTSIKNNIYRKYWF
jgi:hypothetical protein